jgi:hypothetical protein
MGQPAPETPVGGTYSEMEVSAMVRQAIERGGGGRDVFYFEESTERPGYYSIHPKLPELGAAEPGQPPFKIRENVNRLAKGVASKFLTPDGDVDFEGGIRFLRTMQLRMDLEPVDPDDLSKSPQTVADENGDWLCRELGIPKDDQENFKAFAQTCMSGETPVFSSAFYNIWSNWASSGLQLQDEMAHRSEENEAVLGAVLPGFDVAKRELAEMASMDPQTQMRMIIPTECTGSMATNTLLYNLAVNAGAPGEGLGRFEAFMQQHDAKLVRDLTENQQHLQRMIDNPDEEASRLFNEQLRSLSEEWGSAQTVQEKTRLEDRIRQMNENPVQASHELLDKEIRATTENIFKATAALEEEGMPSASETNALKRELSEATFALQKMADDPQNEALRLYNERFQKLSGAWAAAGDPEQKRRLENELQALSENPEEKAQELLNQETSRLSAIAAGAREKLEAETTLKWDMHAARNAASFEVADAGGGTKTYYLTIEGFAPESTVLMEHPGMTTSVSVGVYAGQREFEEYYLKDRARVAMSPLNRQIVGMKEKGQVLLDDIQASVDDRSDFIPYTEAAQARLRQDLLEAYAGPEWSESRMEFLQGDARL